MFVRDTRFYEVSESVYLTERIYGPWGYFEKGHVMSILAISDTGFRLCDADKNSISDIMPDKHTGQLPFKRVHPKGNDD